MSDIEKDIPETEEAEEITEETAEKAETAGEISEAENPEEQVSETAVLEDKIKTLEEAAAADKDRYLRLLAE